MPETSLLELTHSIVDSSFDSELYSALLNFQFEPDFYNRLLRETGWSTDLADRAILEYRRFIYLHMKAGHQIVPSTRVDQVWHEHLLFTHSYWDELCDQVLHYPMHHHPGSSVGSDREFFMYHYQETLNSYQRIFGAAPSSDIWLSPDLQFAPKKLKKHNDHHLNISNLLPKSSLPFLQWSPRWSIYVTIALLTAYIAIVGRAEIIAIIVQVWQWLCQTVWNLVRSWIPFLIVLVPMFLIQGIGHILGITSSPSYHSGYSDRHQSSSTCGENDFSCVCT